MFCSFTSENECWLRWLQLSRSELNDTWKKENAEGAGAALLLATRWRSNASDLVPLEAKIIIGHLSSDTQSEKAQKAPSVLQHACKRKTRKDLTAAACELNFFTQRTLVSRTFSEPVSCPGLRNSGGRLIIHPHRPCVVLLAGRSVVSSISVSWLLLLLTQL